MPNNALEEVEKILVRDGAPMSAVAGYCCTNPVLGSVGAFFEGKRQLTNAGRRYYIENKKECDPGVFALPCAGLSSVFASCWGAATLNPVTPLLGTAIARGTELMVARGEPMGVNQAVARNV